MKTTVEIPDALFREAKSYAARRGVPFREVVAQGLRLALEPSRTPGRRFRLRTVTTKGEGLQCGEDWAAIRSLVYEGHGG